MIRTRGPQRRRPTRGRAGVATVEFAAALSFVLAPMLLGLWEMGRAVHVQQVVSNAAREGARLAAQGRTLSYNGTPTEIKASLDPAANATARLPNVKATVYQSLVGAGLTGLGWNDVEVKFKYLAGTGPSGYDFTAEYEQRKAWEALPSPKGPAPASTPNDDPTLGTKNQRFVVYVLIKFDDKVRWVNAGIVNPKYIAYAVEWRNLVDDPFRINTAIPTW